MTESPPSQHYRSPTAPGGPESDRRDRPTGRPGWEHTGRARLAVRLGFPSSPRAGQSCSSACFHVVCWGGVPLHQLDGIMTRIRPSLPPLASVLVVAAEP
ncbi:hypothetical protein GGTG_05901 [Gaeumannomyces tritici R3-111a-1]|uniref:Uncharacterized protein n=1 Tax=Gaeumannomyces tritici (strain R3-111a-1) TaxID=644352 RepID=J3NX94_GAET3|nr:hypothetical protein GGTG_05901 [Gaeumannomyces tritici R3-111a-1]EJT75976.1 hypothetical protein GGTG_05901 [Gaeumannomyces tritici R3-111a-1]